MDTSVEFIKMCEKAVEVQELWKPDDGDFIAHWMPVPVENDSTKLLEKGCIHYDVVMNKWNCNWIEARITGAFYDLNLTHPDKFYIWLPRQDQLQGMVVERWSSVFGMISAFYGWIKSPCIDSVGFHASMEQLWLAFIVSEKYNKTWTGTEWKGDQHG